MFCIEVKIVYDMAGIVYGYGIDMFYAKMLIYFASYFE